MALNDNAVLVPDSGNFFIATYSAVTPVALPADLSAPGVEYENVGHTSLEDIFSVSSEGGESTTLGTLQNKVLRTKKAARTETFTFTLQQFDEDALKLYFGSNAGTGAGGELEVPISPTPTVVTFLAVFVDGENHFAFYAPKAEVFRNDDINLGDTESLAGLPLGVTPLVHSTNDFAYAVTPLAAA